MLYVALFLAFTAVIKTNSADSKTLQGLDECMTEKMPACERECVKLIPANMTKPHNCLADLKKAEIEEFRACFSQTVDLASTTCSLPANFSLVSTLLDLHHGGPHHHREHSHEHNSTEHGPWSLPPLGGLGIPPPEFRGHSYEHWEHHGPPPELKEYHECMTTCFKNAKCEDGCTQGTFDAKVLIGFNTCHTKKNDDHEAMKKCFEGGNQ